MVQAGKGQEPRCRPGRPLGQSSRIAAAGATGARRRLRRGGDREAVPLELEGQPGRFDWRGRSRAGAGTREAHAAAFRSGMARKWRVRPVAPHPVRERRTAVLYEAPDPTTATGWKRTATIASRNASVSAPNPNWNHLVK